MQKKCILVSAGGTLGRPFGAVGAKICTDQLCTVKDSLPAGKYQPCIFEDIEYFEGKTISEHFDQWVVIGWTAAKTMN